MLFMSFFLGGLGALLRTNVSGGRKENVSIKISFTTQLLVPLKTTKSLVYETLEQNSVTLLNGTDIATVKVTTGNVINF